QAAEDVLLGGIDERARALDDLVVAGHVPQIDRRRRRTQATQAGVEPVERAIEAAAQHAEQIGRRQRRVARRRLLDARDHAFVLEALQDRVDGRARNAGALRDLVAGGRALEQETLVSAGLVRREAELRQR